MITTIEDRLKKSYRQSFDDDAWVDELFADQLKVAEDENNWYSAVCQRCPYFLDGAKTGDTFKKLVPCDADDPDVEVSGDVSVPGEKLPAEAPKLMKWAEIPLIKCVRSECTECLANSFIVTAFVYSQMAREKQVLEHMQARMLNRQQEYKQTQSNSKRNKKMRVGGGDMVRGKRT